jgi:sugar lactone lactonase YvrE
MMAALLVLGSVYLAAWPVGIEPAAWEAPRPPDAVGAWARNDDLADCNVFVRMPGKGPDSLAIDAIGYLYTGLADGRIFRIAPDAGRVQPLASFEGRATGVAFGADGSLLVADERRGVVYRIDEGGAITPLLSRIDGEPLLLVNDLAVGNDGVLYVTESSTRFTVEQLRLEILERRPNGRILVYDPATRSARVLREHLYFPNGIAVAPDQSSLVYAETTAYRVSRLWLRGPKRGATEVLIENLPGFPGDVSITETGRIWVSLLAPRNPVLDHLSGWPRARAALARLPAWMMPDPKPLPYLIAIDEHGGLERTLQTTTRRDLPSFSSVIESGGSLYLGTPGIGTSIDADAIYHLDLGSATPSLSSRP